MQEINERNFQQEVLGHKGLVLVEFYTEWCPPCGHVMRELESCEQSLGMKLCKINAQANRNVSLRYFATGLPSLILFQDGTDILHVRGAGAFRQLMYYLDKI